MLTTHLSPFPLLLRRRFLLTPGGSTLSSSSQQRLRHIYQRRPGPINLPWKKKKGGEKERRALLLSSLLSELARELVNFCVVSPLQERNSSKPTGLGANRPRRKWRYSKTLSLTHPLEIKLCKELFCLEFSSLNESLHGLSSSALEPLTILALNEFITQEELIVPRHSCFITRECNAFGYNAERSDTTFFFCPSSIIYECLIDIDVEFDCIFFTSICTLWKNRNRIKVGLRSWQNENFCRNFLVF